MTVIILVLAIVLFPHFCTPASAEEKKESFRYDEILRLDGDRCKTLGPTGDRLYTECLDPGLGLRGAFSYCHRTPEFQDPLVIEFQDEEGTISLALGGVTWFPSHLEAVWRGTRLQVIEKKFITQDDMLMVCMEIQNMSGKPVDFEITLSGKATPLLDRSQSKQIPVDLYGAANFSSGQELVQGSKAGAGKKGVSGQLAALQGRIEYDAVNYVLADPGPNKKPTLAALRGGQPGDPAYAFPTSLSFPVPPVRPARALLHLMAMTPAPGGRRGEATPAYFVFHFDNGSKERIPWPSVASRAGKEKEAAIDSGRPGEQSDRVMWRFLFLPGVQEPCMQLSYTVPPGRFVDSLEIEKSEGPEIPILLAASVEALPKRGRIPVLLGQPDFHGLPVFLVLAGDGFALAPPSWKRRLLFRSIHLEPGKTISVNTVAATGSRRFRTVLRAMERVEDDSAFDKHCSRYGRWFKENVPEFSCSDSFMEKAWHYRWFLVRHSMRKLGVPDFSLPVFYEGSHSDALSWVTTSSTPLILQEVRWLRDKRFAQGHVRALLKHQLPNGLLTDIRIGERGGVHPHWIPAAAVSAFEVNGSLQYLKEILPLLKRNVEGCLASFDKDGDHLPSIETHLQCLLKGQPSFFFFNERTAAALERPDFAAYLYASARALARGFRKIKNEEEADRFEGIGSQIAEAVCQKMWHRGDRFFYSLRAEDDTPARCREIAGFVPFFAGLVPGEKNYRSALACLVDPNKFWTPVPVATVSQEVSAFSYIPSRWTGPGRRPAGWKGNGPVFPGVESLVAEVLAKAIRFYESPAVTEEIFHQFLTAYTKLHFQGNQLDRPLIRESYNCKTGVEGGSIDCFQSAYNDLLIRFVGGLIPRTDGHIEVWPMVKGLDHFSFRGIPYHGHRLNITWDQPDGKRVYDYAPEGYTVTVDEEKTFTYPALQHVTIPWSEKIEVDR